jgi:hypothetical protein
VVVDPLSSLMRVNMYTVHLEKLSTRLRREA